ncbi:MAG: hypothetical protein U1E28_22715 [Beijerinckiaceae bacterium]
MTRKNLTQTKLEALIDHDRNMPNLQRSYRGQSLMVNAVDRIFRQAFPKAERPFWTRLRKERKMAGFVSDFCSRKPCDDEVFAALLVLSTELGRGRFRDCTDEDFHRWLHVSPEQFDAMFRVVEPEAAAMMDEEDRELEEIAAALEAMTPAGRA